MASAWIGNGLTMSLALNASTMSDATPRSANVLRCGVSSFGLLVVARPRLGSTPAICRGIRPASSLCAGELLQTTVYSRDDFTPVRCGNERLDGADDRRRPSASSDRLARRTCLWRAHGL